MADQVQADPQKLLDVAVQFSTKANDVQNILNALDAASVTYMEPSLANGALSSYDYLWAAWMTEFMGISKATEQMGLALGGVAIGFLQLDGQDPTAEELKDIALLKENFSKFKSVFDLDANAVKMTEEAAKSWDPNAAKSTGTDTPPTNSPPANSPPANSPTENPPKPDGNPVPGENDKIVGAVKDNPKLLIHEDSKGNKYVMNPGVQWISPGTLVRTVVTRPTPPKGMGQSLKEMIKLWVLIVTE